MLKSALRLSKSAIPSQTLRNFSSATQSRSSSASTDVSVPCLPLFQNALKHIKKTAIVESKYGKEFTYAQLLRESAALSEKISSLKSSGIKGERVVYLFPPGFGYAVTQWAIWQSSAIAVPLCNSHPVVETEYYIRDSAASILIAHPKYQEQAQALAKNTGCSVVMLPDSEPWTADQVSSFQVAPSSPSPSDVESALNQKAMIIYTSGTTGKPKGVVTTHFNLQAQITALVDAWEWSPDDRILHILPLHHVHGVVNKLACALWSGATCEFFAFDAAAVWKRIASESLPPLTLFMAVPTIYSKLIHEYDTMSKAEQTRLSAAAAKLRLYVSGSAALPEPILERWKEITQHTLLERYGMSEFGMALSNPYRGTRVPGSVGSPLPGVKAHIVREDGSGAEVGSGEAGELWIDGPNVFREYWGREEATKDTFSGSWFKTGDVAVCNAGVYKIMGRASVDILKSGGYKISALDVERTLLEHPMIREVAVVGVADPEWGQRVAAIVALKKGYKPEDLPLSDLRAWCKERMASYKIPSLLKIMDELPRNAMGKTNKKEMVKVFA